MKFSIVLSTHDTQFEAVAYKGEFSTNAAKIAHWGYGGIELAIRDPERVNADILEHVVAAYGLSIPALGTGQVWVDEGLSFTSSDAAVRAAAIEHIKSYIALAARFNSIIIVGLIRGMTSEDHSHDLSMEYLCDSLRACCSSASEQNVRLALEPLNRYETNLVNNVVEGLEIIKSVGATNLGLLLDTFHMNIEEPSIEESIQACGELIFHVHVADSNRWYPGAGHLDFESIFKMLLATGYKGFVSGEFMPLPDADTSAEKAIAYMKKLIIARGMPNNHGR